MRAGYDQRRTLRVELMRGVGFGIPVMPQGAFYVFADASRWTEDSCASPSSCWRGPASAWPPASTSAR